MSDEPARSLERLVGWKRRWKAMKASMNGDLYESVLGSLQDGVYFVTRDREILFWNQGAENLSGYRAEELLGHRCMDNLLVHVDDTGRELCNGICPLAACIADGRPRVADVHMRHRDGHRVPVQVRVAPVRGARGEIVGAVETFSDNSSKIAAVELAREMKDLAMLDELTGVGNRRFIECRIEEALPGACGSGYSAALFLADIDHFKGVNDSYGHQAGDAVLRATARTLAGNLRSFDAIGRWGGEEFAVILWRTGESEALQVAERCRALVENTGVAVNGGQVRVTISIGVTGLRQGDSVESALSRADRLMYQSKDRGRNRVTAG